MSIADLLHAAEYLERRERGKPIRPLFRHLLGQQFLPVQQKLNMVMQRRCNKILIGVDQNRKNHKEVGKDKALLLTIAIA